MKLDSVAMKPGVRGLGAGQHQKVAPALRVVQRGAEEWGLWMWSVLGRAQEQQECWVLQMAQHLGTVP